MVGLFKPNDASEEALAHHDVFELEVEQVNLIVVQEPHTVAGLRQQK